MIIGVVICLVVIRSTVFYGFCLLNAKTLHGKMLNRVIEAKCRFFDTNPLGRLMNRFSKDVGNIDDTLPLTLFDFLQVQRVFKLTR